MKTNSRILARIAFFLYLAVLFFLCFGRFPQSPDMPSELLGIPIDKIVHFCMFLPFPVLAILAFGRKTETVRQSAAAVAVAFLLGCLLAVLTEGGQTLTDYRTGDLLDLAADLTGLVAGALAIFLIDIRKHRKHPSV